MQVNQRVPGLFAGDDVAYVGGSLCEAHKLSSAACKQLVHRMQVAVAPLRHSPTTGGFARSHVRNRSALGCYVVCSTTVQLKSAAASARRRSLFTALLKEKLSWNCALWVQAFRCATGAVMDSRSV